MTARNIFIISLSVVFLFVFCWLLFSLTKSASRFSALFSAFSNKQVVKKETDVTQQDTTSSSGVSVTSGGSRHTADMEVGASLYSAQDDAEIDETAKIIAKLAAEAGMDPVDFLNMLLAESGTDSKITTQQQASATASNNSETVSELNASNLQMTTDENIEDTQSTSPADVTTLDNISQEELEELLQSLPTTDEEYLRTISELNSQEETADSDSAPEETADSEPDDSELDTENYDDEENTDEVDNNNDESENEER